jgi:gas vesicle protein
MNDQSRVLVASLAGAAIGGLVGYLYLTANGRRLRDELEPRLDEFSQEIRKLRSTVNKAQAVASEGWRSLHELIGERPQGKQQLAGSSRQSSPF